MVAVVGDGALTGGMCWEALNNIAAARQSGGDRGQRQRPLLRPHHRRVGRAPGHACGCNPGYEQMLGRSRRPWTAPRWSGRPLYDALHGVKKGIKDAIAPQAMFEDLGMKYVGPVDGHDLAAWSPRCARAKVRRPGDRARASPGRATATARPRTTRTTACTRRRVRPGDRPVAGDAGRAWTDVFAEEMIAIGGERAGRGRRSPPRCRPDRARPFAAGYPERVLRRRHRRAARGHLGGRDGAWAGCTR